LSNTEQSTLERQALVALRKMRQKLEEAERARTEPIAIIGIGCRLPGHVANPGNYWNLLRNGVDAITEIPPDRFPIQQHFDPQPGVAGKTYSRWGGFMDRIDLFDADFFGISPREAVRMDPQQRVFLEVAWEALEHAGISPHSLKESNTGIFVGATAADYMQLHMRQGSLEDFDAYMIAGTPINAIAGRLAYFLGTHGPSLSIDTACSSSLVAIDRACRSVRDGECSMAIAGGVNVVLAPEMFYSLSSFGMLARDGRCKTFDAAADGIVRAEGCGIVVLKRLSEARANNDRILAVIRGSAVNQDGASSGLSVPNGLAQEAVIRGALHNAGLAPETVSYIEAHGTGTSLGDPIEVEALARVFQHSREARPPVALGSVKTNLGHMESGAGVAALMKVVLMLQHRKMVPHLHLNTLTPHVAWDRYNFTVPTSLTDWKPIAGTRVAGVSAFGFTGTNAHVIVEQAPEVDIATASYERPLHILTVSGRDETALRTVMERTGAALLESPETPLADTCFTMNVGRAKFEHRVSVVGTTAARVSDQLARHLRGETQTGVLASRVSGQQRRKIAFLFTGQGSQYAGMGRQLFETSPIFRETLERCDRLLRGRLDQPLLSILFPQPGAAPLIHSTQYTQPALFALEYSLCEMWRSWGIQPAFVMGHSVGEYVAACVAGVFTLEDGLQLIATRARLMQAQPAGGRMMALLAGEQQVRAAIAPYASTVSIAAVNGPHNVVISGAAADVGTIAARLAAGGVVATELKVSHAFHSPLMAPMLSEFETAAAAIDWRPPSIRLVSNLTGRFATAEEVNRPDYWRRHVREAVRFADGIKTLAAAGCDLFLELGPTPTLLGMARQCIQPDQALWLGTLRPGKDDWEETLSSVQAMFHAGVPLDWKGLDRGYSRRVVTLPTYPFQRERHWLTTGQPQTSAVTTLRIEPVRSPAIAHRVFQSRVSARNPAFLQDHRIGGRVVFPATGYVEIVLSGARALWPDAGNQLDEVTLHEALVLNEADETLIQVLFHDNDAGSFEVFSTTARPHGNWTRHVTGRITRGSALASDDFTAAACTGSDVETFYQHRRHQGAEFGPEFRSIRELRIGSGEALARIALSEALKRTSDDYVIHPVLLDGCLQTAVGALPEGFDSSGSRDMLLPVRIGSVRIARPGASMAWCHARLHGPHGADSSAFTIDLKLRDADHVVIGEVRGLELRRVRESALRRDPAEVADALYEIRWQQSTLAASTAIQPGTWLVLADDGGVAIALRESLLAAGHQCVLARPGAAFEARPESSTYAVNPASAQEMKLLVAACCRREMPLRGVIHLWSLDDCGLERMQLLGCGATLHLVQALSASAELRQCSVSLVTRMAQAVTGSEPVQAAAASIIGLRRVIGSEYPDLLCSHVDLDGLGNNLQHATALVRFALYPHEREIAIRAGTTWVPRLLPLRIQPTDALQLQVPEPRILENLAWGTGHRRSPKPDEIEVAVRASGLNFRDVLTALGMRSGDSLGGECSGVVVAVGDGIDDLRVGDRVMGYTPAGFSSYVTVRRDYVARVPQGLDFTAAAALPVAFLTAQYGLHRLAKIQQGERVLIHAAAGGVGLAAVQIALQAGAEVYATLGSEPKRRVLEALGVKHLFHSRTLDFSAQVLQATGGRGVDIVLNSLAGEFIPRSVAVLAPGGRFLEIGKRDILTGAEFTALRPDCRYHAYDLGEAAAADRTLLPHLYSQLLPKFARGELCATPVTAFPHDHVVEAFQQMAAGKHIGKLVVTMPARELLRADATYLITGGLGALGLGAARWLVRGGARHVVLLGRHAPSNAASQVIAELTDCGAQISIEMCDVSDEPALAALMRKLASAMPPLRGIVHAAGVLDDGVLEQQTWERFESVMAAKVRGGWLLHNLSASSELDFFVLFSAFAAIAGPIGQGNYAAANTFLDALAHHRRARGLPAVSVNWGPWAEGGMVAALSARNRERLESRGLRAMAVDEGFRILERILQHGSAQVLAASVDWQSYVAELSAEHVPGILRQVVGERRTLTAAPAGAAADVDLAAHLAALPAIERLPYIVALVEKQAARALRLPPGKALNPQRPLHDMGLDSLVSVELRNALAAAIGRPLSATLLFDYPTIDTLAGYLATQVLQIQTSTGPAATTGRSEHIEAVRNLSDEEAEAALLRELDGPAT
jgi:acyl transferase domain-containing protein/NADPH:quinone reductase-like Zn-dependent oxidoreductase/short-subunit dehydrogenase